ncbi:MAG: hypothetical protein EOP09_17440, partial [Proteobacteria bacterium]
MYRLTQPCIHSLAMLFNLFLCLLVPLAIVAKRDFPADYSFEQFMHDFHLNFPEGELPMRREIFRKELARVIVHNARKTTWTETINKFSAMTLQEKRQYMGRNKHAHQASLMSSAQSLPADMVLKSVSDLPTFKDWRDADVVSPVKDQGRCGSCWAFAATAVVESSVAIASGLLYELSTEQMAMCAP